MTAEEEISNLRKQIEAEAKKALRQNRQAAYILGIISMVALIAIVVAFFEQTQEVRLSLEVEKAKATGERESATLKKQIQIEIEKSQACEKAMLEHQAADAEKEKLRSPKKSKK